MSERDRDPLSRPGQPRARHARRASSATRPSSPRVAIAAAGDDPFDRCAESTRFAQPAILCASLAAWTRAGPARPRRRSPATRSARSGRSSPPARSTPPTPSGSRRRAAGSPTRPGSARLGGMLALRCDLGEARRIAAAAGVAVANDNSPTQVVVSGPRDGLDRVAEIAAERGVRARLLGVSGAFHSPAMAAAVEPFEAELERIEVRAPRAPGGLGDHRRRAPRPGHDPGRPRRRAHRAGPLARDARAAARAAASASSARPGPGGRSPASPGGRSTTSAPRPSGRRRRCPESRPEPSADAAPRGPPLRGSAIASVSMAVPGDRRRQRPDRRAARRRRALDRRADRDPRAPDRGRRRDRRRPRRRSPRRGRSPAPSLAASELDLVVVATMSHERLTPSASALLAERIGATRRRGDRPERGLHRVRRGARARRRRRSRAGAPRRCSSSAPTSSAR